MAEEGGDKNKRRGKYIASQSNKRRKQTAIPHSCQGFLITCDGGRESQCAREAMNLLDEFLEKCKPKVEAVEKEETQKSFDDRLKEEIAELKSNKMFSNIETGCNGIVFIHMKKGEVGPSELGESIVRNVAATKRSRTRFSLKLLPVEMTCYASAEEVTRAAKEMILRHFPEKEEGESGLKFAVVYEARANTGLERMSMIDAVARLVPKPHSVDLKNPNKTIIVQVVKTTCTIGVISDYKELSKYNLRELGTVLKKPKDGKKPANKSIKFDDDD